VTAAPTGAPDAAGRLAVRRLSLAEFRCYRQMRIEVDARPVVLTGPNGAGKTNLLEALSFLVPGRGLRRAPLAEVVRADAPPGSAWGIAARLDDGTEIGTGREAGAERRAVRLDGRTARPGELAGRISVVWLTPAMDRLFAEGAAGRRRFLDRLVFALCPGHAQAAGAFDQALRERTRLLRAAREEGIRPDPAWLAALEEAMARHGVAMAAARLETVVALDAACRGGLGPFPAARLDLDGEVEGWLAAGLEAKAAESRLAAALRAARGRDQAAGQATVGPHRSDLAVRHGGRMQAVARCSTGEQKAVLVSIVLGHARVQAARSGRAPLLLLDEVVAHLDAVRRAALFDELAALGAQSWMTGTDALLFDGFGPRAQFFRVSDATVAPDPEAR